MYAGETFCFSCRYGKPELETCIKKEEAFGSHRRAADDAGVFPAACRQKVMCQNRRFGYVQVRSRGGYTVRPYAGKNLC